MKTLRESLFDSKAQMTESLFDNDLTTRELPYQKLLKGIISKDDILNFIEGSYEGDFLNIKNPVFLKWCHEFWNKEVGDKNGDILRVGFYAWNPKNDITLDALDWIKPGKIHNKVHWNDAMYANSLDVYWSFWGKEGTWDNITEWVLVTQKSGEGYNTFILVNRKEYDEIDQQIIHKLIQIVSKVK